MQLLQLRAGESDAAGRKWPGNHEELAGGLQRRLRLRDDSGVIPYRPRVLKDEVRGIRGHVREVQGDQSVGDCGLGVRRRARRPTEAGGLVKGRARSKRPEHHEADHECRHRVLHDASGDASVRASLHLTRTRMRRPEDRTSEDGKEGGKECQAGQEHRADADGKGDTKVVIDPERGEQQAEQGEDDGTCGRRNRLADPSDGECDGVLWVEAVADALSHAEHEKESVVRSGAEDDHDQQQLGDLRDLKAGVSTKLADDGAGKLEHDERRQQRDQRRQHGAEDQQQEHDDEQQGEILGLVAGRAGLLVLVDGVGHLSTDIEAEPRRRMRLRKSRRHRSHSVFGLERAESGDVGQRCELDCLVIRGDADELDVLHVRYMPDEVGLGRDGGNVGLGQLAAVNRRHDDDRLEVLLADERRGEVGCLHVRRIRRQERRVVVVDNTAERGQGANGAEGAEDPDGNEYPTEPDRETAERREEGVHQREPSR